MAGVRLPLILSLLGHAGGVIALVWMSAQAPPLRPASGPAGSNPVQVVFKPPPPAPPAPAAPAAAMPAPAAPAAEPEPQPAPEAAAMPMPPPPVPEPVPEPAVLPAPLPPVPEPKPPIPEAKPRPPPPAAAPDPKDRVERRNRPPPYQPPAAQSVRRPPAAEPRPWAGGPSHDPAPPQSAALPPPAAAPRVAPGYRMALARWFESRKHYPDGARARREQGQAVLRFRVDRSGRVLSYSIVQSAGYPELDAAVAAMMRGARLPPFPEDMHASEIEVSVPVRFTLGP